MPFLVEIGPLLFWIKFLKVVNGSVFLKKKMKMRIVYRQINGQLDGGQKVIRTAHMSLKVVRLTQCTFSAVFDTNTMT